MKIDAKISKILKMQLDNCVDLEKCEKMSLLSLSEASILPRTNPRKILGYCDTGTPTPLGSKWKKVPKSPGKNTPRTSPKKPKKTRKPPLRGAARAKDTTQRQIPLQIQCFGKLSSESFQQNKDLRDRNPPRVSFVIAYPRQAANLFAHYSFAKDNLSLQ